MSYPIKWREYLLQFCIMGSNDDLNIQFGTETVRTSSAEYLWQTTGVEIQSTKINIEGMSYSYKLILCILSGKKYFQKMKLNRQFHYQASSVAIILFDSGVEESLKTVSYWYQEFRQIMPDPSVLVVIVAIKSDQQKVSTKEGKQIAKELNAVYFETAIDNREKIDEIFVDLVKKIDLNRKG